MRPFLRSISRVLLTLVVVSASSALFLSQGNRLVRDGSLGDPRAPSHAFASLQGQNDNNGNDGGSGQPNIVHVENIEATVQRRSSKTVLAKVTVRNQDNKPTVKALVSFRFTLPDGRVKNSQKKTGPQGVAPFKIQTTATGTVTLDVTNVKPVRGRFEPSAADRTTIVI